MRAGSHPRAVGRRCPPGPPDDRRDGADRLPRPALLAYEIPKWDGDIGRPSIYVPLTDGSARRKVELLYKCFPSQRGRDWWDDEVFLGLARLRGMECRARYAEAFWCTKAVIVPCENDPGSADRRCPAVRARAPRRWARVFSRTFDVEIARQAGDRSGRIHPGQPLPLGAWRDPRHPRTRGDGESKLVRCSYGAIFDVIVDCDPCLRPTATGRASSCGTTPRSRSTSRQGAPRISGAQRASGRRLSDRPSPRPVEDVSIALRSGTGDPVAASVTARPRRDREAPFLDAAIKLLQATDPEGVSNEGSRLW